MPDQTPPIAPRVTCPPWCDLAADEAHRDDYDSTTAGLLARMHSTTIASTERFTVDLVALETADPDGAAPLLDPASIALYGLEDSPQLSAADALDLADALRAAAARLPQLDEAPR